MPYYVEKNGTKYEIGTLNSDCIIINDRLDTAWSASFFNVFKQQNPTKTDTFLRWNSSGNGSWQTSLDASDGTMSTDGRGVRIKVPGWADTPSTANYKEGYDGESKAFLAGRYNCPVPNRKAVNNSTYLPIIANWTNDGTKGFKYAFPISTYTDATDVAEGTSGYAPLNSDMLSYVRIKRGNDAANGKPAGLWIYKVLNNNNTSLDTLGTAAAKVQGSSMVLLDIQAPGGEGGLGNAKSGALSVGGGAVGGSGGGGGAFCTLLIDFRVLEDILQTAAVLHIKADSSAVTVSVSTVVDENNSDNYTKLVTIGNGQPGRQIASNKIPDYGDFANNASASAAVQQGGAGGEVFVHQAATMYNLVYLIDRIDGTPGGAGEVISGGFWGGGIKTHVEATEPTLDSRLFAPGPFSEEDCDSIFSRRGRTGISSNPRYAYGGGGGCAALGYGGGDDDVISGHTGCGRGYGGGGRGGAGDSASPGIVGGYGANGYVVIYI